MTTSAELNISPYWDWHNSKPRIYTRQSQGRHPIWNENQAPCKLIIKTRKYNRFQQLQHTNTQNLQKHETRNNNHLKQKSINFQAKLEKEALTSLIATSSFVWMLVPSPPKPKIKTINHQHTQQNPRRIKRTMSREKIEHTEIDLPERAATDLPPQPKLIPNARLHPHKPQQMKP